MKTTKNISKQQSTDLMFKAYLQVELESSTSPELSSYRLSELFMLYHLGTTSQDEMSEFYIYALIHKMNYVHKGK